MNRTNLAAVMFLLGSISAAHAEGCDIDKFDTTPPRARLGNVANPSANFSFASDVDDLGDGRVRIWNYVSNKDSAYALSAFWPKANINIPYFRPLPAGAVYCNWVEAENSDKVMLDDDAPITYGNVNSTQPASVYMADAQKKAAGSSYFSSITSAYEKDGKVSTFDVQFTYFVNKDKKVEMAILSPDDVYVGISNAPSIWSKSTLSSFWDTAKSQSSEASISYWDKFVPEGPGSQFLAEEAFKAQPLLISKGTVKGFSGNETYQGAEPTPVVIFDENKIPLVSGYLSIPVTYQQ